MISGRESSNRANAGTVTGSYAVRIRTENGLHAAHPDHSRIESGPRPDRSRPT